MKNLKLNILQTFILLFSIILITGCSNKEVETGIEQTIVENLNTLVNRQLITDLFTKGTDSNRQLLESIINQKKSKNFSNKTNIEELLIEYQECSSCQNEYKKFLIPFFQEIKNMEDSKIVSKIEEYEIILNQSDLSSIDKENLKFALFSFKEVTKYSTEYANKTNKNIFKNKAKNGSGCGRALGQGLVSGFVAGCIRGGLVGAAGGTVAIPGLGTVGGAVGGCIANGAVTGVISAFSSWAWCAIRDNTVYFDEIKILEETTGEIPNL